MRVRCWWKLKLECPDRRRGHVRELRRPARDVPTNPEKFDVIATDPIHPWVKSTSTLYSREYYELVKRHLNPDGVAAQWLPIYESDEYTVSVFPNGTVWSNYLNGDGYDLALLSSARESNTNAASPIHVDALQRRLEESSYTGVAASLAEAGFHSAVDLLALNMRLQHMAGLGWNSVTAPQVYREVVA